MQPETHYIATSKQTAENKMGEVFTKGKEYKARSLGEMLMVRDNFNCIRHFHSWKQDKVFKAMFTLKEVQEEDNNGNED